MLIALSQLVRLHSSQLVLFFSLSLPQQVDLTDEIDEKTPPTTPLPRSAEVTSQQLQRKCRRAMSFVLTAGDVPCVVVHAGSRASNRPCNG